jgi:hypothetical protein
MRNARPGKRELLTDKNSALVPADYQPAMFAVTAPGDKAEMRDAAYCAAKSAGYSRGPAMTKKSGRGLFLRIFIRENMYDGNKEDCESFEE